MDNPQFQTDLRTLKRRVRDQRFSIGGLFACLFVALLAVYRLIGAEHIVVSPPTVTHSFWLSADHGSNDYLEQMGGFVAWLALDLTPTTVDWKKDQLLGFVAPEEEGRLKIRQELEADRLKKFNMSTYFLPQQFEPDEEKQSVLITGRLRTLVNGQETSTVQKRYLAEFSFPGGRTRLKSFKEVKDDEQKNSAAGAAVAGR